MNYNNKTILKALTISSKYKGLDIVHKMVNLERGIMIATDLTTFTTVTIPRTWKISGTGVVPLDVIKRALSCTVVSFDFNAETNMARVEIDGQIITVPYRDSRDFPEMPAEDWKYQGELGASGVASVLDFIGKDDLRPAMMGVYVGEHIVGTNGHILRYRNHDYAGTPFILNAVTASVLTQFWGGFNGPELFYAVLKYGDWLVIHKGAVMVYSRAINETYPRYMSVIPDYAGVPSVTVNREELYKAVKAVTPSASKVTKVIALETGSNAIMVTGQDIDTGTRSDVSIDARNTVEIGYRIGFNAKYLETVCSNVNSEEITFKLDSPNRAGLVGDMLIMPIDLNYRGYGR
jgi:DNA polymerase-3 subunit beta